MTEKPLLYLAGAPATPAAVPTIFRSAGVREVLEHPPELRHAGFNLVTLDFARIVEGERLTVANGERKQISLFEDGTLTAYAAFHNFLGWPREAAQFDQNPKINNLALIEFVSEFVRLYNAVLAYVEPSPSQVKIAIGLRNAHFGEGRRLYLVPGRLGTLENEAPIERHEAPRPEWDYELEAGVQQSPLFIDAEEIAFRLVSRMFVWFEYPIDSMPYVASSGDRVDAAAFES